MRKTIIFYGLLLLTFVLFIHSIFVSLGLIKTPVTIYAPLYNKMNVILETEINNPEDIILKINDEYNSIPKSKNVLNKSITNKVKTLDILISDDFKNKIESIVIFNDLNSFYYSDFSEFEKSKITLCPSGKCKTYSKYKVPDEIKFNKNADSYNYRNHLNSFCMIILSLFSGNIIFFIPYILLFIAIIYFINNKEEIKKPKISWGVIIGILFILAILFRTNGLYEYLPWADEYYSVEFSNPSMPFLTTFSDPGNPPLFYILFRFYLWIFDISVVSIKTFPFIFGILSVFSMWWFLNKKFDLKTAAAGLFLFTINLSLIYYSQETRSYIVQVFLAPLFIYLLFKILEENKNKYYVIYGVMVAVMANIHYYEILFIISNFLYGMFFFLINKRKKEALKFFALHLFGGLFFIPYFAVTALNKALLNASFNDWIPDICFGQILKCVLYLFGGIISFILSIIFFIKNGQNKDNEKKIMINYCIYTIFTVFLLSCTISYIVRPILVEKYTILLIPVFIIFLSCVFTSYKNKYLIILFLIWVLSIQASVFEKNNRRKGIIDGPLILSYGFYNAKKPEEDLFIITNLSSNKFLNVHQKYVIKQAKYIPKMVSEVEDTIDEIQKNHKNSIIITSILDANKENLEKGDNYTCYFNSATDVCIWKIEN